jgi:hypothetical protein
MQTECQEGTVGIIPPSRRCPPLIGSHYSVSALVLIVGAILPPLHHCRDGHCNGSRPCCCLPAAAGSVKGSGGGRQRQRRRRGGSNAEMVCGVCSRVHYSTYLGEQVKSGKSAGSPQELYCQSLPKL